MWDSLHLCTFRESFLEDEKTLVERINVGSDSHKPKARRVKQQGIFLLLVVGHLSSMNIADLLYSNHCTRQRIL